MESLSLSASYRQAGIQVHDIEIASGGQSEESATASRHSAENDLRFPSEWRGFDYIGAQ
jgi:hypothetical protein